MSGNKKEIDKSAAELVKDLEVLPDEALADVSGGNPLDNTMGQGACGCTQGSACGGGCGPCGPQHEANFKLDPSGKGDSGDVIFNPKKIPDIAKKKS